MSPTGVTKLLVAVNLVILSIGAIDAGLGSEWDLFILFVAGFGISFVLFIRLESRRPAVPIRRDLVAWLRDHASVSGESLATVTDRAVSTFVDRYGDASDVEDSSQ